MDDNRRARAVIYCRVSDDAQRGNFSIPSQLQDCTAFANERGHSIVGDHFVDPVDGRDVTSDYPGAVPCFADDFTSLEMSRPALNAVQRYLETYGFEVLIVHHLDRLSRDPYIRMTLEAEFKAQGVRVMYVLGDYDDSPEGEVRKDLDSVFAKWENATRLRRSLRGKRQKAEFRKLFVQGRAPMGYRIDPTAKGGLAVEASKAAIVRQMFEWYVREGSSINEIARRLTGLGIETGMQKGRWSASAVRKILHSTTYIGFCYYGKTKAESRKQVPRDRSEWIEIQTLPIVDLDTFEAAQLRLKRNQHLSRFQPKRFYLLAGMVTCYECARPYNARTRGAQGNTKAATYYVHTIRKGHCRSHQIPAHSLDCVVWSAVTQLLLDPESLRRGYGESLERQQAKLASQRAQLETLDRVMQRLNQQLVNLTKLLIDPEIQLSKQEYLAQRTAIEAELRIVEKDRQALQNELDTYDNLSALESLEAMASQIKEYLEGDIEPSQEDKRMILEMLHVRVIVHHDKIRLTGWFDPQDGITVSTESRSGLSGTQRKSGFARRRPHRRSPTSGRIRLWRWRWKTATTP